MIEDKGEWGEGNGNCVKELDYDQIMINPVATQMHFTMAVDFQGLKRSITTIIIVVSII